MKTRIRLPHRMGAVFVLAAARAFAQETQPLAPVRPVVDTYFGHSITDPYRWMESKAPELDQWMKAQNDYTRAYRDALRKCSTRWAPWYVVPSDSRTVRNYLMTRVITNALSKLGLRYPKAPPETLKLASRLEE